MSNDDEGLEPQNVAESEATVSRRQILRRVGAVGIAAVWATPIVQTIGSVPAFATGTPSPPPPTPSPPPTTIPPFHAISYVGLVFTCNGTGYKAKWEEGKGFVDPGRTPFCTPPPGWDTRRKYANTGAIGVSTTYIKVEEGKAEELYQISFTLPSTCSWADGAGVTAGVTMGGTKCVDGVVGDTDPLTITFTAPAK